MAHSIYLPPSEGPFFCAICKFFTPARSGCTQKDVIAFLGDRGDGQAQVAPFGCSDEFKRDPQKPLTARLLQQWNEAYHAR